MTDDNGASLRDRACAPDGAEPASPSQAEPLVPSALQDCVGALQFVLAFYEPGQTYLDTEAWKQACASGVRAYNRGAQELGWDFLPLKADGGSVYKAKIAGAA